jgi:serine phosphatase RsbU (regulator of sigma subunit)
MTTDASWSVFAMPLIAHGRVAGIVTLYAEPGRELQSHEQSLLEAACQQMAIGVENARLYRDARASAAIAERRADNLTLVHRISRLVSSSLDPTEIVQITAEQVVRLFGVDHCGILLFDEEGARGEVVAEYPALGALGIRAIFIPGDYLEEVPGRGELGLITDILHDPRARAVRDIALRMGVQVSLLIPLISRGRSIGVITLNMLHRGHEFSDEEHELGRTIAAQVAIALENARLYQMTRTRVEQEMEIARSIQANLFPRQLPAIPGATLAGQCLPALETGGDFYDVLAVDDDRFGFSIGDVSGKSLPAAMLMAVARSIVRSEAIDHATPERVVTETNRLVAQDVLPSTFVSLCYAVYEAATRRLILANAGHIVPLIRRADGRMEWTAPPSNLPLGILADTQYEAVAEQLYPGDSVLFMTDGLVEVFSPEGEMFGFDRLAELFRRCGALPANEVVATLLDTICIWRGRPDRDDDMTAVVLQIT